MSSLWQFLVWLAETLDPINSLIGLATTLIAGFTAVMVWREGRRARHWWQEIRSRPGRRPAILILDLLPERNVRAQVENFRQQHEVLRKVPDDRIITIGRDAKLMPEHMPQLQKEIRRKVGLLSDAGVDRVHVFLAAPQPAAAIAGGVLANVPATLYHFDAELGTYVNYGPLRLLA